MPDVWMDVDVALAEVPVNILPLIDDTDFKSRETALAYNQAGMDLVWNFVTSAGAMTQTAVMPTTADVHDWTNQGDGMYTLEIPASGGTINNDTEGFGWFTGYCTGVLPWRGPIIGFRRAALNDLLIEGGTASTNLEDFFDGTGYAGGTAKLQVDLQTIKTQGVTCAAGVTVLTSVGTAATSTAQTGDSYAIVNGESGLVTIDAVVDSIKVMTDKIGTITNTGGTATIGAILGDFEATTLATRIGVINNNVENVPTVAEFEARTIVAANYFDPAADIVAHVTLVDTTTTNTDMVAAAPSVASIADAVWDEAIADHADVGSAGAALSAAGGSGDPWATALPGTYEAGTAGKIIGDNINAPIGTVDTVADAIKSVTDLIPNAGAMSDLATLASRLSAARAGYLDELNAATSGKAAYYIAKLATDVLNKKIITETNGNTEQFNDADGSLGSIASAYASDGTYTTRKRMVI